jgi:hypothetical protein
MKVSCARTFRLPFGELVGCYRYLSFDLEHWLVTGVPSRTGAIKCVAVENDKSCQMANGLSALILNSDPPAALAREATVIPKHIAETISLSVDRLCKSDMTPPDSQPV